MTSSPLMGFNHNIRHLGWLFHVQTEDSGTQSPHIITHLFQRGVILATKRVTYAPVLPREQVRALMQNQHKTVLRELKDGVHNERIQRFLGESPVKTGAEPVAATQVPAEQLAASWPQTADLGAASGWEWREELLENPEWVTAWLERPASSGGTALKIGNRSATLKLAPIRPKSANTASLVVAHFPSSSDLLQSVFPNSRLGGLVVHLSSPRALQDQVSLMVSVDGETVMEFSLEGVVSWLSGDGSKAGIAFPSSEHAAVRRMILLSRGSRAARTKAGPHPLSGTGDVVLLLPGNKRFTCSADVTEHGLFIPEDIDVPPGTTVPTLLQTTDNQSPLYVVTVAEFSEQDGGGVGLVFQFPNQQVQDGVIRWVDALLRQ